MFICVDSVLKTKQDFIIYLVTEACWGVLAYVVVLVWFDFRQNDEGKEKGALLNATGNDT